jgi:cell division protein FtsB
MGRIVGMGAKSATNDLVMENAKLKEDLKASEDKIAALTKENEKLKKEPKK